MGKVGMDELPFSPWGSEIGMNLCGHSMNLNVFYKACLQTAAHNIFGIKGNDHYSLFEEFDRKKYTFEGAPANSTIGIPCVKSSALLRKSICLYIVGNTKKAYKYAKKAMSLNPDNDYSDVCKEVLCHRSRNFVSDSKSLFHLKILGSNKINTYCPAAFKVTEHTDGKCVVSYQKMHIGHQNALGHLFLTADEKKIIASKIAAQILLDNILDEIKNSISDAGLQRIHLLTKNDLHNIKKTFNLSINSVKHENDRVSVNM
ncbi:MULE domain-containing protein [Trichonephila inaurata madagascariensis]|uniref:MULE domain-containing protein n=1 Tax=Trichonephila inaurata madagascariensis TaxID=2747483 RepID=A0A8X6YGJ2_9ARAC|nr:MULE domain-containing protein [Trichonephila inaurata madagascariensis]